MKRGIFSPKIVRQRKMKILLTASANDPVASSDETMYDTGGFVAICHQNWTEWIKHAVMEREKTLEMVSQYPTSSNIGALLDIEALVNKMTRVSRNFFPPPPPKQPQNHSLLHRFM